MRDTAPESTYDHEESFKKELDNLLEDRENETDAAMTENHEK